MTIMKTNVIPVINGAIGTISKSFRQHIRKARNQGTTKNRHIGHCTHTSESANVKEQQNQRRNQTQRHHKQQRQNSCNNVSPRDMVRPTNMCVATLHKGDNDDDNDNNNNNNNNRYHCNCTRFNSEIIKVTRFRLRLLYPRGWTLGTKWLVAK